MKIVIGGQIDKDYIFELVKQEMGDLANITVKSDLDAAMDLKSGVVDYYIGACNTGGGGALAMAMALVGPQNCVTLSMPGNIMSENLIVEEIKNGKKAFGFTAQDKDILIPIICRVLKKGV